MPEIRIRDTRTLPFFWISKALIDVVQPTWRALIAYNALAYFSVSDACKDVSIPRMAKRFGISRDSMKRGLQELAEKNAIVVKSRYKKGRREQLPNEYILIDLAVKPQAI